MFSHKIKGSTLTIGIESPDTFVYSISDAGNEVLHPIKKAYYQKANIRMVNALIGSISECVATDYSLPKLINLGQLLYQQLIPRDLSETLGSKTKYYTIVARRQDIPWELLHDGDNFLGVKYCLGRGIEDGESIRPPKKNGSRAAACLLVSNPSGDLPEAESETHNLLKTLRDRHILCDYVAGEQASVSDILLDFNRGKYDFIHYSGHIARDPENHEFSFVLAHGEYLPLKSIGFLGNFGNPFVFINACGETVELVEAGLERKPGAKSRVPFAFDGIVIPFIYAGAQSVLGSAWKVSDKGARVFAEKFYQKIFGGRLFGDAIADARAEMISECPTDAAWASFTLYGSPGLCFTVLADIPRLPGKLAWEDFGDDGWRVVEEAVKAASCSRLVNTLHLFHAVSQVRRELLEPISGLDEAGLGEVLRGVGETLAENERPMEDAGKKDVRFSRNAQIVLCMAYLSADSDDSPIEPRHILEALLDVRDAGITGFIETARGQALSASVGGAAVPPVELFDGVGVLRESVLPGVMVSSLRNARSVSGEDGIITTTRLFIGMLSNSASIIHDLFSGIRMDSSTVRLAFMNALSSISPSVKDDDSPFMRLSLSSNTIKLMELAMERAAAGNRKAAEYDFIYCMFSIDSSISQIFNALRIDAGRLLNQPDLMR